MKSHRESFAKASDSARTAVTRRRALLGLGGVAASTLAGCLGSSTSGSSSNDGGSSGGNQLPAPVQGNPDSNTTVAVYEDFACPHCRRYNLDILPQIKAKYIEPGAIRYEHHDMPVVSEVSWRAASGARAVQDRAGDGPFFTYARKLYENQQSLGSDTYASLANEMKLDGEAISNAAMNQAYEATVSADRQQGLETGVSSTPTVLVNGTKLSDYSLDTISSAIESAK